MKRVYILYIVSLLLTTTLLPQKSMAAEPTIDHSEVQEHNSSPFISKGEIIVGLSASYGTVSSNNSTMLYLVSGIDASLSYGSIDPFVGYFYRDNRCAGFRLGYGNVTGKLDSATLDFGESNDIEIEIPYVNVNSSSFNYSVFHRNYLPLDKRGNFGLFAEFELMARDINSVMSFDTGGAPQHVKNKSFEMSIGFNPGVTVFVMNNVSTNVSFGLGGLGYTKIKQLDSEGNVCGSRTTSELDFKFNIIDINFGITIHL